jgi:hypothetical protein
VLFQGQPLDRGELQQITNVGDCPGEEQPELRDLSFLAALPPARSSASRFGIRPQAATTIANTTSSAAIPKPSQLF